MTELAPRLRKRKRDDEEGGPAQWLAGPKANSHVDGYEIMALAKAMRKCAFRTGFAPEGMLCNEPPIPLRVLDFLGTYELVNLSLVCKATHRAGHLLLEREVRGSTLGGSNPTRR
jgi:hypothetical protein